jgi:hypothetical protein
MPASGRLARNQDYDTSDLGGGLNRSTQHRGQLAINNDDGLPNARQIAFGDFPRNQLSHNTIFSAAPIPLRSH